MNNSLNSSLLKSNSKDKQLIVNTIVQRVESCTGLTISKLKEKYSEERFFYEALKHVTTTKKALCKALKINIDNACRYKRCLEINGYLVQSIDEVYCSYTGFKAHLISTNPKEFLRLSKSNTNQLNLFD